LDFSDIAKGYVKSGHEVSVVTMHYKGLPSEEEKPKTI